MLTSLRIRRLAIIDELTLEFGPGFNVLTGETGAGKSILIDALGLVIGARADAGLVRHGAERAEIDAEFDLGGAPAARAWLDEAGLTDADDPEHCVVRRLLGSDGRGRAFINGSPVAAGALRELGEQLVDVFGQNESQTLVRREVQRQLVDGYGRHEAPLQACANAAAEWLRLVRERDQLAAAGARDPQQLAFLRYQLEELEALDLQPGELEALDAEHRRLSNAEQLIGTGTAAYERLYGGEPSAFDLLSSAAGQIAGLAELAAEFAPIAELLAEAQARVDDAAGDLRRLVDRLESDPDQLGQCEARISAIQDLARKHRLRPEALIERRAELAEELGQAENAGERQARIEAEIDSALRVWRSAAEKLHAARVKAAATFSAEVSERVRLLGMPSATLVVAVERLDSATPAATGDDEVRFDFSANPGQAPRPLSRVASGGELSRISLAIQVVGQQIGGAPTMIFDEVDAGIGGGVAEIVGQQLRDLGRQRQVLCVTHLAQVASQGQSHFRISKRIEANQTFTQVSPVADEPRVDELARMLGGIDITDSTRQLARELVGRAADR